MEILKFKLGGLGGVFTRPTFNSCSSSYSHIHKVSILGMIGAIIGIEKTTSVKGELPSFFEKLQELKVAIVPKETLFFKQELLTTETVGFANISSTLLLKAETLINPEWEIYVLGSEIKEYSKLKESLINRNAHFTPYLGRNHWFANISEVEVLEGSYVPCIGRIDGLFEDSNVETEIKDDFDFEEEDDEYFQEYMPVKLVKKSEEFIQYQEENLIITNRKAVGGKVELLHCNNKNLYLI